MYEVSFKNVAKALDLPFEPLQSVMCADLERALALASMLQKVSTPEVQFGDITVQPFKSESHG